MNAVYAYVTERIIAMLEQGTIPWHKPWSAYGPVNYVSRKPYRGINSLLLDTGEYLTFRQVQDCKGQVKKGAKSHMVVFWKPPASQQAAEDDEGEENRQGFVLRYYKVLALADCEGIPSKLTPPTLAGHQPLAAAQAVIDGYAGGPTIKTMLRDHADYSPDRDLIRMPLLGQFETPEAYHATLFHEAIHSTGHKTRLDRFSGRGGHQFGSTSYSKEELIAEIGAAMLCAHVGIGHRTIQESANYIQAWLSRLREDKTLIVSAASKAQRAADLILGHVEEGAIDGHQN